MTGRDGDKALSAAKSAARRAGLAARAAGDPGTGTRLAGQMLARLRLPHGAVVAGYWPLRSEIDPRPLMLALAGRGHGLVLPVTGPRGTALGFRRFRFGDPLCEGPFGTREPLAAAEEARPAVLLVPLVAFDDACRRLGHGAGYYDRTLAALRESGPVLAIGLAYAAQRLDAVPAGPQDVPLDAVVTERGVVTRG